MPQTTTPEPKGKTNANYFDQTTEDSIVKFQKEPDIDQKKKIFLEEIFPAFAKLIENIIYVYKFHNLGDVDALKNDCMSFLFETLYKFDSTKGCKAFSYFNVIAKNWFIQRVKTSKKKNKSDIYFDKVILNKIEKSDINVSNSYENVLVNNEFLELLRDEIKKWRTKFDKKQERLVLEAVILLLDNPDIVSITNKKAIYLYMREITNCSTKQIVTNLIKLRKRYKSFKKSYMEGKI